jgi:hypothetical protein
MNAGGGSRLKAGNDRFIKHLVNVIPGLEPGTSFRKGCSP